MNIFAQPEIPTQTTGSDRLPRIGETIRMRLKPRAAPSSAAPCPITDEMLPPFPFASLDRVTSGRERSTE